MPKKSHQFVIGIILVAVFFSLGFFFNGENSPTITGRVIEDTIQDNTANNPSLSNEDTQNQEESTEEDPYEVYEYYEYGGECSFDIKQAEDDVNDILSYLGENDDEYQKIKEEYEYIKEVSDGIIIDETEKADEIVFNGKHLEHETFVLNKTFLRFFLLHK